MRALTINLLIACSFYDSSDNAVHGFDLRQFVEANIGAHRIFNAAHQPDQSWMEQFMMWPVGPFGEFLTADSALTPVLFDEQLARLEAMSCLTVARNFSRDELLVHMWEAEIDRSFQSFVSANVELLHRVARNMAQLGNPELEMLAHRNMGYALDLLLQYPFVDNSHLAAPATALKELRDSSWSKWLKHAAAGDVIAMFRSPRSCAIREQVQ